MFRRIYMMYDTSAESVVGPIMQYLRPQEAIRAVTDSIMADNNMLVTHPDDFKLFELGRLNIETCSIEAHAKPLQIITVREIVDEIARRAGNPDIGPAHEEDAA